MARDGALRGHIDEPASSSTLARGLACVSGWVFHDDAVLDAALLVVDDAPGVRVKLGPGRADVQRAYPGVPHAGSSGFEATIDLRASTRDVCRIALIARVVDGPWTEAAAVEVALTSPERLRDGARGCAAFTIVRNEATMLPIWLRYYGRYFDPADLYVLDHGSSDRSTARTGDVCQAVAVHHGAAFDPSWLRYTVESFQAFLLRSYDTVLFAEVDELVVADPRKYSGLDAYIERLAPRRAARCVGFNVVHQPGEPALRFDTGLLQQRRYWRSSSYYAKRLLSRVPLHWSDGFHEEYSVPDGPPDPDLVLVHLHRVDYNTCLARHRAAAAADWNAVDIERGAGAHNRIADPAEFESWFRGPLDGDGPLEPIPEHIRAAF